MKKVCSSCSIEKPNTEFYSGRRKCKDCYREVKRNYVKNKPEKVAEYRRKYYEENRESILEQKKDYIMDIAKMVFDKPYQFLFINTESQRLFKNFDELLIEDERNLI